jgi:hypothetical protein
MYGILTKNSNKHASYFKWLTNQSSDVVVADPTHSTAVMVSAVERGDAARLAAEMKVGKYGDQFPEDTFVPLAVAPLMDALTRRSTGFSALALDGPPSFGQEV